MGMRKVLLRRLETALHTVETIRVVLLQASSLVLAVCAGAIFPVVYLNQRELELSIRQRAVILIILLILVCVVVYLNAKRYQRWAGAILSISLLLTIGMSAPTDALLYGASGPMFVMPMMLAGVTSSVSVLLGVTFGSVTWLVLESLITNHPWNVFTFSIFFLIIFSGMQIALLQYLLSRFQQVNQQLRHQATELAAANDALLGASRQQQQAREFISYYTHHLANSSKGIRGLLGIVRHTYVPVDDEEAEEDLIGSVESCVNALDKTLQELSILSREGKLSPFQPRPVEVLGLLAAARSAVASEIPITIQLGGIDPRHELVGDGDLLQRALETALHNAIQSLTRSQQPPLIELAATVERGWISLIVADNGPGMPESLLVELLRLQQEHKGVIPVGVLSTRQGGSARGLPLISQVAKLHGGVVQVQNRQIGGCEVKLIIPERFG